jgi:hypothetical protein
MNLEMMRTYPVPVKDAFAYMLRFKMWPKWAGIHEIKPKGSKWETPGDIVHFVYQPFAAVGFEGELEMVELKTDKLVKALFRMPGIDEATMTWLFTPVGDKAFTLKIELETPELEAWWAKAMHALMFHGPQFENAMIRQLDGLDEVIAKGLPKAPAPRRKTAARKTAA